MMNVSEKGRRNAAIVGCMAVQLCVGILYLWSAFKGDAVRAYGEALGWTPGSANLVASFMLFAYVSGCLIGGFINDRKGPRPACITGIALFAGGVALAAFARHIVTFTLAYAVMAGLGAGFANVSCVSCAQKWLPHRRGLASGLAYAAFGFSTVVFAPLSVWLMDRFRDAGGVVDFQPVFLILAALFAALGFAACCLISLPGANYLQRLRLTTAQAEGLALPQAVKTPAFWTLFLSLFFFNGAWNLCVPVIKDLGMRRGLTEALAVACLSFTGIVNTAGRLLVSAISDRTGRIAALASLCAATCAGALLTAFASGMGYFAAISLVAFAYGGSAPVFAALCADLFGPKHLGANLGAALLALGLSSVFFNFVSSNLLHSSPDNMLPAFVMGAIAAVIPTLLIPAMKRR